MAFRLVNPLKLQGAGYCAICERRPHERMRVVDTGINNLHSTVKDKLRGRKYVCSDCGDKLARAFAYTSLKEAAELRDALADAEAEVADLREQVDLKTSLDKLIERLGGTDAATVED